MKIKVLITALFAFITISTFAQKRELENANDAYNKFFGLRSNAALSKPSLADAKTAIDKAVANPKTAALPQTFALKAAIYAALASTDADAAAAAADFSAAQEAYTKAKTADTKNENASLLKNAQLELAQIQLNNGVKYYQDKKYDDAYKAFDGAHQMIPDDTTAIYYTALSASNAKNYAAAISKYNDLLKTNYSSKGKIAAYEDLTTLYLFNKDTAASVKTISEAVTKYPGNTDLRKREIEVSLQAGQQGDLIGKIEAAIKTDPNNKTLYFYEGLTYSQMAETAGAALAKIKKTATKAAAAKPGLKIAPDPQIAKLIQTKGDNFDKAAEQYKKAIALDANYFDAVLNMGYVSMAPAIDLYNEAQQLPASQMTAYNAAMGKASARFDLAKPYLLKALELNPTSLEALTNLKSYYLGKKDTENANAIQKKIDALPAVKPN